jgi:hypothetical protein
LELTFFQIKVFMDQTVAGGCLYPVYNNNKSIYASRKVRMYVFTKYNNNKTPL